VNNRDKLLAGARRSLAEKGYTRTTARDITASAGTSLAAIGYHFGSIEALLNAALHDAVEELGEQFGSLADVDSDAPHQRRFEEIWARVITSVREQRPLWLAQFETFVQAQHVDALREPLVASVAEGKYGLAELFAGIDPKTDERTAWLLGSLCQSLLMGMVMQWMLDPDRALTGRDLADALRILVADLDTPAVDERGVVE
jgi:AcrR family transcriptional regulator